MTSTTVRNWSWPRPRQVRWLKEPTPASARMATGGPPTPFFRTILMTPPTALSPYSTAPLLPRVISMRSIESRGMVEKSTPAMSMSLSLRPLMSTRVFEVAKAPNPRRSTLVLAPLTPPNRLVSCTPGACAMISCSVCAGECAISSRGDDGRRRADDAGELPAAASARALRDALRCDVRAGPGCGPRAGRRRSRRYDAARGRCFIVGRFGAGPVRVGGRG